LYIKTDLFVNLSQASGFKLKHGPQLMRAATHSQQGLYIKTDLFVNFLQASGFKLKHGPHLVRVATHSQQGLYIKKDLFVNLSIASERVQIKAWPTFDEGCYPFTTRIVYKKGFVC
jgi:hypothetical protein